MANKLVDPDLFKDL